MTYTNYHIKFIIVSIWLMAASQVIVAQSIVLPEYGICAHRGAMTTHPENTIAAFKEAIRLQAKMIEFDVRLTKDKKLVVLHDESVERTTNGTGKIKDLTLKQVKKLDAGSWKSADFINLKIPTLSEALAVMPHDIWLNVHLKGDEVLGKKVAKVILKEKRIHQAFLACGAEAALGAHEVSQDILICNMDRQNNTEEYVRNTIENKSAFIQLYKVPVDPGIAEFTEVLKANNVRINYCCTDSPEEVKQLVEYGVDFVLVNKLNSITNAVRLSNVKDSKR